MTQSGGIPFLRIRKPQPENLTRVIRSKITQKLKHNARFNILRNYYIALAEYEDRWDEHLATFCNIDAGKAIREDDWASEYRLQTHELGKAMAEAQERNMEIGGQMWEILMAERKLIKEEEKAESGHIEKGLAQDQEQTIQWKPGYLA